MRDTFLQVHPFYVSLISQASMLWVAYGCPPSHRNAMILPYVSKGRLRQGNGEEAGLQP